MKLQHCRIWQPCDSIVLHPEKGKSDIRFYVLRILDRCYKCGNSKYELITDFKTGKVHTRKVSKQEFDAVWVDRLKDPGAIVKETKGKVHVSDYTMRTSRSPEQAIHYLKQNDPEYFSDETARQSAIKAEVFDKKIKEFNQELNELYREYMKKNPDSRYLPRPVLTSGVMKNFDFNVTVNPSKIFI